PRLSEKVHLESAPEFHSHVLLLRQPEIGLFFDYYPEEVSCRPEVKILDQVYRGRDCWRLLTEETSYDRSPTNPRQWFSINRQPLKELGRFLERNRFEFAADSWLLKERGDLLKFMLNGLQQLPAEWLVTTSPAFAAFKIAPVKLEPQVHVELDGKIDWFDFEIYYNLGGVTYTQREIQAMIRRTGSGNYILAGDQWFFIEEAAKMELLERSLPSDKTGTGPAREKGFNLVFFRQLLQEQGITIQGNAVYDQFEADISGANLVKDVPLPETLRGELRPYQKEGFNWLRFLHKYRFGGILADDMGLGKTIQALTLIKSLPKEEPSLVVCPRSLVYNWAAEVDRFYPGTARLVYHGPPETRERLRSSFQDQEIIITTYDIVVNDIEALQNYFFYYCILDEAQQIKNQQTQRAKECKKITARHRLVLTGTPVENRLEDLWSLFDFLLPDYLGNQNEFKEKYVTPLKKPGNQGSLDLLKRKIAPFMLRRRKEDVLAELPPKIITQRNVLMTQLQEDVYRAILKEVQQEVLSSVSNFGLEKSRLTVLSALTKLRQLCDHPSLAVPEVSPEVDSGKIEALMELILEAVAGGHKIVVFSQFVRMLKLIRLKFQENRLNYVYLDGSTTDRQERIDCFNSNPDIPVFLISLKAGGVGINLTAADIVIQVDPWWNPMVEEQATDRVHRIGQQKQVLVYKLVTAGTVEEKLVLLQQRKKALFDAVFKDYNAPVNSLTWEDIKELLEINE
ncbi:MAG: DEAD/DEAH box helicase, partial [Bacillota bacterium]